MRSCHLIDFGFPERLQIDVRGVGVVVGGEEWEEVHRGESDN